MLYTFGYRFSLSDFSFRQTGGLFIHAKPAGVHVTVGFIERTTSFLTGNVFIQNLQPASHTVRALREGYQPWEKTIVIKPQTVTELFPLLMPLSPIVTSLNTASSTHMIASPRASLLMLRSTSKRNQTYTAFDISQQRVLPFADTISSALASSISEDATWHWNQEETSAIIETPDDWLLLEHTDTAIRINSLYRQSALAKLLSKKPRLVAQDPENPQSYFLLDGTNFARWNTDTHVLQQLLQSIAGFSVRDTHLLLWDMQSGFPYTTTLDATNARPFATTSMPNITNSRMDEINADLLLRNANDMWFLSSMGKVQLLTDTYHAERVAFTNAYILWWDADTITMYWIMPEVDLPVFQEKRQEILYTSAGTIQSVAPYPAEQYLIIQEDNAIYALELDGRGGTRNKHLIYKGDNPVFYVSPDDKLLYIHDRNSVFTITLP